MLSGALLSASVDRIGGEILPRYLTRRDHVWLTRLLEEHEAHVGRRKVELDRRLGQLSSEVCAKGKLALARAVLEKIAKCSAEAGAPPKEARAATFRRAARSNDPRDEIVTDVAEKLGVTAAELELALFADLPSERRVRSLGTPSAGALADEVNAALIAGWIARATSVEVRIWDDARPLVRHARRLGLICVVTRADDGSFLLEVSGPAILFRKTAIYGRALASLVPQLRLCTRFALTARCSLPRSDETAILRLDGSTLSAPARELYVPHDRVERRLRRDVELLDSRIELIDDPEPVAVDDVLVFPDFELVLPGARRRWLIEIVGFWTPQYLQQKLSRLDRLSSDVALLLSVDAARSCAEAELPIDPRLLSFDKRIDARELLCRFLALDA